MRESRTYGSVRGALSNERPYRDLAKPACPRVFGREIIICCAWARRLRLCPPYSDTPPSIEISAPVT